MLLRDEERGRSGCVDESILWVFPKCAGVRNYLSGKLFWLQETAYPAKTNNEDYEQRSLSMALKTIIIEFKMIHLIIII